MKAASELPVIGYPSGRKEIMAYAVVDADLMPELSKRSWSFGGGSAKAYPNSTLNGKTVRLHILVCLLRGIKIPRGHEVDHWDRNPLNNQSDNLRIVTRTGNMANRGAQKNSGSGYRGVSWSRTSRKWLVSVCKNGRRHHIGYFKNRHDGAGAVNAFFAVHFPGVPPPNVIKQ